MDLSCGAKCIKYLLFIFNALVFIFGAVITGFGIYMVVQSRNELNGQAIAIPAFILTVGLLVFLIGFLGCCGACKEHVCMLKTFAVIIIILLILQIIAGILVFVYRSKFTTVVAEGIAYQIKHLDSLPATEQKETRKAFNKLQQKLNCCGGHGPEDWGTSVPPSCCKGETSPCNTPYKQGCAKAMYEMVKDKALIIGIIIVVMAIIQLGAVISACCLAKKIGEYEKV
ncbi:hypothetical protein AAHC03_05570 [Spirometra sp. Aus1]